MTSSRPWLREDRSSDGVSEVVDGVVYFHPICPGAGWWHAKAREIVAHWRKTGQRGGGADEEAEPSAPTRGQLLFSRDSRLPMSSQSAIEWCDATWNVVTGSGRTSPG